MGGSHGVMCREVGTSPSAAWCSRPTAVKMAAFSCSGSNTLVASRAPPSPASTRAMSTCSMKERVRNDEMHPGYF